MHDFIGDVHGYAGKLKALLGKLGYSESNGAYVHTEGRKVVFVGDYIDRGPEIPETLRIVKSMVDSDNAIALMGNHEYNALCFHFRDSQSGGHLRQHSIKNIIQHYETLRQFQNKQKEYESYLEWFKTLPLFFETDTFRAVHACWDHENINCLKQTLLNNRLTDELIILSADESNPQFHLIEETLKGKEIKLPEGNFFMDKDGTKRSEIRIKWWEDPSDQTYRSISVHPIDELPEDKIKLKDLKSTNFYEKDEKKVFFGHYWLKGDPILHRQNICCLDYSVAKKENW